MTLPAGQVVVINGYSVRKAAKFSWCFLVWLHTPTFVKTCFQMTFQRLLAESKVEVYRRENHLTVGEDKTPGLAVTAHSSSGGSLRHLSPPGLQAALPGTQQCQWKKA